jgi:FG-GAP-like repeat/ASPIC and UnbV
VRRGPAAAVIALSAGLLASAGAVPPAPGERPPRRLAGETPEKMHAEFEGICRGFRAGSNAFYGLAQIQDLRRRLATSAASAEEAVTVRGALAQELLREGESEEAARLLEEALQFAGQGNLSADIRLHVLRDLGLAHLRRGEQKNCIGFHGPAACIVPIEAPGVHRDAAPARAALETYLRYLRERPEDDTVRWLANVAAMTAGEFPEGIPPALRVGEKAFSSAPFPRFRDVAMSVGLHIMDPSGGAIVDDFDGDGRLDVVTTTINPCGPMHFFHNDGKGGFEERTARARLDSQWGGLNVIHADYDNDGRPDLLVLRGGWMAADGRVRLSLLRNDGDGGFTDVTREAGLAGRAYPTQAGAWADYDNDGWLDLYVGSEVDDQGVAYPSRLFHSRRDGTFEEVAEKAGVENFRMAKGVAWGDYDGDGYPDLYVSNIGANRLYHNDRDGTFTDVAAAAGVAGSGNRNFPTWFFDYDNDGRLDLFDAEYSATTDDVAAVYFGRKPAQGHPRLYHNEGNGRFREVSVEAGLTDPLLPMGSNYGDLDNDGWLDFYLGTGNPSFESIMPKRMYRNVSGKRFEDVTFSGGFGHIQKGHGVSFADFDDDGDQDVFEQMGGAYPGDAYPSVLYENPGNGNAWVKLRLVGSRSNRSAIGARVEVVVPAEGGGERSSFRTVGAASSFGGSPIRQEIGLGKAERISRIEIVWPASGRRQVFRDVVPRRFYEIREDRDRVTQVELGKPRPGSP